MRVFVGCLLDMTATRKVQTTQRALRPLFESAGWTMAWVPPPNLHITLRFLGDIDVGLAPAISDELSRLLTRFDPVRLELGEIAAFPTDAPRVLYATIGKGTDPLTSMAQAIDETCVNLGLAPRERAVALHVTLARVKKQGDPTMLANGALQSLVNTSGRVGAVTLYRSDLLRTGAEYHALSTHVLQARA